MKAKYGSKFFSNEMLFVLYLFIFSFIKPILLSSNKSAIISFLASFLILIASFSNRRIKRNNFIRFMIIIVIIFFVIGFDAIVRPNSFQNTIPYHFLVYGIIPLFLMINIQDFKSVLKYYCIFSIVLGFIYLPEPFLSYRWSSDYMQFGFLVMLPAVAGSIIGFFVFKKRYCLILGLVFVFELLLFGNKGAFLAAAIHGLIMYIMTTERSKRRKKIILIFILSVIVLINLNYIFEIIVNFSKKTGVYSYSLTTLRDIIYHGNNEVISVRYNIWANAWKIFLESPIVGHGTVYLEGISNSSSGYAHNIFLDIMVCYGILGLIYILFVIFKSIRNIFDINDIYYKNTIILFFVMSIIPLSFSLTFWKTSEFWILIGLIVYRYNVDFKRKGVCCEKSSGTYI